MSERQWYYVKGGQQCGPVSETSLIELLRDGSLGSATRVWTQGMENWHEASTINSLAPAVLLPSQGGPPLAAQSFYPARPTSMTVFGILNIVFGSLGLLCMPVGLIAMFAMPHFGNPDAWFNVWLLLSSAIGLVCAVLLIAAGIGLLYLKAWARVLSLGYGWFAIVWGLIGMLVNMGLIASGAYGDTRSTMASMTGGIIGGLVGLIYPILLIVFMRRPNVKDACTR